MLTMNAAARSALDHSPISPSVSLASSILMIELPWTFQACMPRADGQTIVLTHRRLLSRHVLETVQPEAILTPLIAQGWDLLDLGSFLLANGYHGQLCAVTQPLPRIEMVINEVSAQLPCLAISVIEVPTPTLPDSWMHRRTRHTPF